MDIEARFWAKVDRSGDCWLWTAALGATGYGHFWDGANVRRAHRWAYERFVGPIPAGLVTDHLCRVRRCVRPDHIEIVTSAENTRRGNAAQRFRDRTHCPQGHPYEGDNLEIRNTGARRCRECNRAACRDYYRRKRGARDATNDGSGDPPSVATR